MQCKDLEIVLENEGLSPLPEAAQAHLAACSACQDYIADLSAVVTAAKELPIEAEPPARIWISLRAQLEQEGIIKTPATPATLEHSAPWWHGFRDFFRSRALATAAVGVLILGAAVTQMNRDTTPTQIAQSPTPSMQSFDPMTETAVTLDQQERDLTSIRFINDSDVDHSLRENLQTLNQFISDCKHRVQEQPQDRLAREYLSGAYQQKAELLSAMMDRGGSGN